MSISKVNFNTKDRPEFYRELNKRVNNYFKEKGISKHANLNMKVKTAFMILLYATPFVLMLSGVVTGLWPILGMWFLMGLGMSGIGLSVMHDANHRSYSNNPKVNNALGFILNFIGGYHVNWKIQHNVLHHSFTNVEGHDEDIETIIMRQAPGQERKKLHRFQAFYAPFFYGLMTFYWLVSKDFEQLVRYDKKGLLAGQQLTYKKALTQVIIYKVLYVAVTLVLPILVVELHWWQTLLGFLMMQYISGLILALVFQPAHVINETKFYTPDDNGSVENNWAIHQLLTTANFAKGNRLLSWYVGGLNYQIEHHLFPNICHVHYRNIAPIVKNTAEEYGIPYHEHKTFTAALKSHFTLLHRLGTGRYDKQLAAA
ncbi:MAG: acyl-CoA desaturase [Flavobacteriales bacterium]|nr:acyl-CoA desaturase [Flavobacteriales bacterium]